MSQDEMESMYEIIRAKDENIHFLETIIVEKREEIKALRIEVNNQTVIIEELRGSAATLAGGDVWAHQIFRTEAIDEEEVNARQTVGSSGTEHECDSEFHLSGTSL